MDGSGRHNICFMNSPFVNYIRLGVVLKGNGCYFRTHIKTGHDSKSHESALLDLLSGGHASARDAACARDEHRSSDAARMISENGHQGQLDLSVGRRDPSVGAPTQQAEKYYKDLQSLHGEKAAQRRAISELLFFTSVGDLRRCERICVLWNIKVSDPHCCDYDKRTPLHLAASEGCYQLTEWLLSKGADINAYDRFQRTPLQEALTGNYTEVAQLLAKQGAKVRENGKFVDLSNSHLSGAIATFPKSDLDFDPDWEVDPRDITLQDKLGEGEFGIVHKAKWHNTLVAAKIIKDSSSIALGDFRSELDVLRRVHHPNAVQFLGACTKQQPYIIITELMTGGSLADAFRLPQEFTIRRSLEIAVDTARGLAYMHNKKPNCIIHRDLKPGNLMISGSAYHELKELVYDMGTVKLADFGLSKTLPVNKHAAFDLDDKFKLTGETGSYRFMAREVFVHEAYNNKVDVYSFAMILFQLFEHTPPFAGVDPVEAAKAAALENKRPRLEKLNSTQAPMPVLKALLQRCWDPSADNRPDFVDIVQVLDSEIKKLPREAFRKPGMASSGGGCCSVM